VAHISFTTLGQIVWAALLILGLAITFRLKSERKISVKTFDLLLHVNQVAGIVLSVVFAWEGYERGLRLVEHSFEWAMRTIGPTLTQLFIAAAITGIGVGAYKFKGKNRKWYGRVEVIVGFLSALAVVRSLGPDKLDLAKWSTLAGCAYVIARGLDNYYYKEPPAESQLLLPANGT
jgi:hypothetical protein